MIYTGDALDILKTMPSESVNMCVTSPPYYGLRDYGVDGQIGLEKTPEAYIDRLTEVFREVRRVLRNDGTLWVNIGDSYAGSGKGAWDNKDVQKEVYVPDRDSPQSKMAKTWNGIKPKDLIGIPWMLAFALRADGWYLRQDIIWQKPNPMPESVRDRCTKSHEYIFLLSKSQQYFFNHDAMKEQAVLPAVEKREKQPRYGGKKYTETPDKFNRTKSGNAYDYTGYRNRRDVWSVTTQPFAGAHFAVFPEKLVEPCVLAGSPADGTVLDCFNGSGTTGVVCAKSGRNYIGIELNPEYVVLSNDRIAAAMQEVEAQKAQYSLFDGVTS